MGEITEEIIELYTEEGEPSGTTIRRGEAATDGLLFPVVCVWVRDEKGRFLVTLRSKAKKASPLKWENPGGACRQGETLAEGAARELFEETGIQAAPEELRLVSSMVQYGCLVLTYSFHTDRKKVVLQEGETEAYKWVSERELFWMLGRRKFAEPIEKQIRHYRKELPTF